jgi:hypothetical protein
MGENSWAIRKGDWKLTRGDVNDTVHLYKLNADGTGELTPLEGANPDIVRELTIDYVDWEVQMGKGSQTTVRPMNQFDRFRFRTDVSTTANWRDANVWVNDASPGAIVSMRREDSYANAVVVFHPRNDASFTSTNNISRMSGLSYSTLSGGTQAPAGFAEFMLNEPARWRARP